MIYSLTIFLAILDQNYLIFFLTQTKLSEDHTQQSGIMR